MPQPDVLQRLTSARGYPVVSLYVALDQTSAPADNERRLEAACEEAAERLRRGPDGADAARVVGRLSEATDAIDLQHPPAGVAVFATPEEWHSFRLSVAPRTRVVVAGSPALRDLLLARQRTPNGRALLLAMHRTRLLDVVDGTCTEHDGDGFPVVVEPPVEADTPHRDFPLAEHERAEAARFAFRVVDRALAPIQNGDPRPLVLVGVERDLAYYDEVTRHGRHVVGRVHGNHEHDPVSAVAPLVLGVLREHAEAEAEAEARRVTESIGSRAVAGIEDVACAVREGRGRRLVVEEDYVACSETGDDRVDSVVADVVAHGGDVVHVRPGALRAHGRIALALRY